MATFTSMNGNDNAGIIGNFPEISCELFELKRHPSHSKLRTHYATRINNCQLHFIVIVLIIIKSQAAFSAIVLLLIRSNILTINISPSCMIACSDIICELTAATEEVRTTLFIPDFFVALRLLEFLLLQA